MSQEKLNILKEDNHILVAVKAPGQLAQGDKSGDASIHKELKNYIKEKYKKPGEAYLGLVHRLDRPVGGLMIFARTSKAARRLSRQFQLGETEKIYLAWVEGSAPNKKILRHKIGRRGKKAIIQGDGQEAILTFSCLYRHEKHSLLLIQLETGRHHQIRLQLSAEGFPILGDKLYGIGESWKKGQIALYAFALTFLHPTIKEKQEYRHLPPAFWNIPSQIRHLLKNAPLAQILN
ncbi:MAG TPA: RNA pseudouridine synthase [Candidatus Marinimicrobia bacterium]|nr:RNA pseudouridine synthase [Candidatus Neomarinimicrobiota bacterium]